MIDPDGTCRLIAEKLRNGGECSETTVREILSWFGQKRRGAYVVAHIRKTLGENGLKTVPDFEGAFIDANVSFELAQQVERSLEERQPDNKEEIDTNEFGDSVFRIRMLPSANRKPISVTPNSSLGEAVTLMLHHDYSQLPVMNGARAVKGMVTWKSIGSELALGAELTEVRQCMENAIVIPEDTPLLVAIRDIVEQTCVLVVSEDKCVSGIVTTSDLSEQFQQLTEPFLLISEIESQIADLISIRCKLDTEYLAKVICEGGSDFSDNGADRLTFGHYVTIFSHKEVWSSVESKIDQAVFVKQLEEVRKIRNDIMHFNTDPSDEIVIRLLRRFVRFMELLLDSPRVKIT